MDFVEETYGCNVHYSTIPIDIHSTGDCGAGLLRWGASIVLYCVTHYRLTRINTDQSSSVWAINWLQLSVILTKPQSYTVNWYHSWLELIGWSHMWRVSHFLAQQEVENISEGQKLTVFIILSALLLLFPRFVLILEAICSLVRALAAGAHTVPLVVSISYFTVAAFTFFLFGSLGKVGKLLKRQQGSRVSESFTQANLEIPHSNLNLMC